MCLGRREAALSEQYDKAVLSTQTTADQVQQAAKAVAAAQGSASQARGYLQAMPSTLMSMAAAWRWWPAGPAARLRPPTEAFSATNM